MFRLFSLLLLIAWKFAEKKYNDSVALAPCEHGQAMQAGTLIHQQLNILANDCDLSDKPVHYLHALHSDDCEQSDKLNITNH